MQKTNITYHRAFTDKELQEILNLQKANLKSVLSESEKHSQGFVTVNHSIDVLARMNDKCPHCIAKVNDKVVGYALCMLNEFRNDVPELVGMFKYMDGVLESKQLSKLKYFIMGQVCIDRDYRGQGVFRGLYAFLKSELKNNFDFVITEVNSKNIKSSRAHQAVGFKILDTHEEDGENWELILLEL